MRKLEINKKYEFTIRAPELDTFHAEFSLVTGTVNYNIKMLNVKDNIYELMIPSELSTLPEHVEYKIQLFCKNNCFIIDSGKIELIKVESIKEKEMTFEVSMVNEEIEPTETPIPREIKKIELSDLVKKTYINDKVQQALKDLKRR